MDRTTKKEKAKERMRLLRADPEYRRREASKKRAKYAEKVKSKRQRLNDILDETEPPNGARPPAKANGGPFLQEQSLDPRQLEVENHRSVDSSEILLCSLTRRGEAPVGPGDSWGAKVAKYEKAIKEGPTHVCCCCGRLWFQSSITKLTKTQLLQSGNGSIIPTVFQVFPTEEESVFCTTCTSSIRRGNIPTLCLANGLHLPPVPPQLESLTRLEERLISARHVFQTIWPVLGPHGQYKIKGGIVNVPVCVDTTVHTLPRNVDDSLVIHLRLARKMAYLRDYMSGNVRPIRVYDAAKYLVLQPMYQEHNIVLSLNWESEEQEHAAQGEEVAEAEDERRNEADSRIDEDEDFPVNPGGGETLITCDEGLRIAPAEGNRPVSILLEQDTEFLTFPKIFGGQKMYPSHNGKPISSAEFFKSLAMRYDRRCVQRNDFLLFMAKKLQLKRLTNNISTILRKKTLGDRQITAGEVASSSFVDGLIQKDHGYRVLQGVRSSGEHWRKEKLKVMAMIRQFGLPTFFLTLTAAETQWTELLKFLKEINDGEKISDQEAMDLPYNQKAALIQSDPVTCARYFDKRFRECKKTWSDSNGPFGIANAVSHHYFRIEFQHRGSPHSHCLLWIRNSPVFNAEDPQSMKSVCDYVDKIISCSSQHDDPAIQELIKYQQHRHTATCRKKKGRTCRFNIPFYPMDETRILLPLNKDEISSSRLKELSKTAKELREHVEAIPDDGSERRSFAEFLATCKVDFQTYLQLIRVSLDRPKMFLKREPRDVFTNPYCVKILALMRSNMDLQFIFDAFGCATYIIDYINKSDKGMSVMMQKLVQEIKEDNLSVKEGMRKIVNTFYNNSELSIQEAAYNLLQLPLSESSEQEIYIPTGGPEERIRILKSPKELQAMDPSCTSIFVDGLLEHYTQRPDTMESMCLADFAALYMYRKNSSGRVYEERNECLESEDDIANQDAAGQKIRLKNNSGYMTKRQKPRVIRFSRLSKEHDEEKYWRSMITMYVPWSDEERDLVRVDPKAKAEANIQILNYNRNKYNYFDEECLETAMQNAHNSAEARETEEEPDSNAPRHDIDDYDLNDPQGHADVFSDMGEYQTRTYDEGFCSPGRMTDDEYFNLVAKLNPEQRDYLMHISNHFVEDCGHVQHLVTGGAGVGKSLLIAALYQTFLRIFNSRPDADPDKECVLLCAPTGMAAFNIKGRTLHSTFHFQKDMKDVGEISASVSNTMATKLIRVQVVIIDEISMVSGLHLYTVDKRLRHIFNENIPFGGRSVLAFGDFYQLPCVMSAPVYSTDPTRSSNKFRSVFGGNLWSLFKVHHLTQIMRQSNIKFQTALNNLAKGTLTQEDNRLFLSRTFPDVPAEAATAKPIHLFSRNNLVDAWNENALNKIPGPVYTAEASDVAIGNGTRSAKIKSTANVRTLQPKDTMSLRTSLRLKVGARYMVTLNIDTADGLVNGAIGTLMRVDHGTSSTGATKPLRLWVKFHNDFVGARVRQKMAGLIKALNLDSTWTPILPTAVTIQRRGYLAVSRKQFPLTISEAITIHKSQGSTYAAVTVNTEGRITREMMYVACSRATSAEGLFIIGNWKSFKPVDPRSELAEELRRHTSEKLETNFRFLRENKFNAQVIYHNVQSLKKNVQQVVNDEVYLKSDVLLFGETWTLPCDSIEVPGFVVVARADNTDVRRPRGACALVRSGLLHTVRSSGSDILHSGLSRSISYAWAVLHKTLFMSVYAAPNAPPHLLQRLFDLVRDIPAHWKLVVGDLNRNVQDPRTRAKIDQLANTAKLTLHFDDVTTTKAKTKIDLVFSNFPLRTGVYASLSSFHKPVWVGM